MSDTNLIKHIRACQQVFTRAAHNSPDEGNSTLYKMMARKCDTVVSQHYVDMKPVIQAYISSDEPAHFAVNRSDCGDYTADSPQDKPSLWSRFMSIFSGDPKKR